MKKMKKIIILQSAGLVFFLAGAGICLYCREWLPGGVLLCAAFVLLAAALICMGAQKRVMDFLVRQSSPAKNGKDVQDLEVIKRRIDLFTLQSQINPHFLYNTLDSIRGEAMAGGQMEIARMTEHLSRFFRYCISNQEHIVKLSEEIRHVEDYFYIQKYRFGDRVNLEVKMEQEQLGEYYLPKITLQPIVENAIAHGLEGVRREGKIQIRILASEKNLYIWISDNGIGMKEEELQRLNEKLRDNRMEAHSSGAKRHTGIAVKNVNARIRLCFGEQYGLRYRSIQGYGTTAEFILPLIDDFNREECEKNLQEI